MNPRSKEILFTSDLHVNRGLTSEQKVVDLARRMAARHPELIVVLGDVAHGVDEFQKGLQILRDPVECDVLVIPGNHDIWRSGTASSKGLYEVDLRNATERAGCIWFEDGVRDLGDLRLIGGMLWYDYSSRAPLYQHTLDKELRRLKHTVHNDGRFMDEEWDDIKFAQKTWERMERRIREAAKDHSVRRVVICTHIPVFDETRVSEPGDDPLADAYFYNFTVGETLRTDPRCHKVSHVISGHTHRRNRFDMIYREPMDPIQAMIVDSDYGAPTFCRLNLRNMELNRAATIWGCEPIA